MTLKYIRKHFIMVLLLSIVPAVLFMSFSQPIGIIKFFYDLFSGNIDMKTAPLRQVLQFFTVVSFERTLLWLLTFFLAIFMMGVIYCLTERIMQFGTLRGISIKNLLKNCLLIIMPSSFLFMALAFIVGLIATSLVFFIFWIIPGIAGTIVSLIVVTAVMAVCCAYVALLLCWLGCMSIEGLNIFDAVSLSSRLCSAKQRRFFITVLSAFFVAQLASFLFSLIGGINLIAVNCVLSLLCCMTIPVYLNTIYLDLAEIPRGDLYRRGRM